MFGYEPTAENDTDSTDTTTEYPDDEGVEILDGDDEPDPEIVVAEEDDGAEILTDGGQAIAPVGGEGDEESAPRGEPGDVAIVEYEPLADDHGPHMRTVSIRLSTDDGDVFLATPRDARREPALVVVDGVVCELDPVGDVEEIRVIEEGDGPRVMTDGGQAIEESTEADPATDLTRFQLDCLATVAALDGTPHGLAVKERLEEFYGGETVHHGRLYPNLDTLVNKGLVEKGTQDRRTNSYTVTKRGRDVLQHRVAWLTGGGEL